MRVESTALPGRLQLLLHLPHGGSPVALILGFASMLRLIDFSLIG